MRVYTRIQTLCECAFSHSRADTQLVYVQQAESLTENTTVSEGGIVVFNFRILEEGSGSKAKCCFLLQDKDSEIDMYVSNL